MGAIKGLKKKKEDREGTELQSKRSLEQKSGWSMRNFCTEVDERL